MDVYMIKRDGDRYVEFFIDGIETYMINTLRRTILTEVPTLAIHDVIIHKNTSVLYDEELALRLALIPLHVDKSEIDLLGECNCYKITEECVKCTARLRLKKSGVPDKVITVYSGDIECVDKKTVKVVVDNIPIAKLGEGQEIDVEMIARVGRGKDHAKWMPVSTIGYKPLPKLIVNDACDACGECVNACPKGILKIENGKPVLDGLGMYSCDLDRLCVRSCPKNAMKIEPDERRYIFRLESVGQLKFDEIFELASKSISDKALDFLNKLKEKIEEASI
ncbi:MAG: DNA-directed RNA polymerase subunit D [Candidatus Njordarchaeia archaeon]|nr:DNA-directed RNA polymerase subunit D [Candidatus Korarchaeota archaeon]